MRVYRFERMTGNVVAVGSRGRAARSPGCPGTVFLKI